MTTLLAQAETAAPLPEILGIPTAEALTNPFVELALAALVLAVVVAIHGWCLGGVQKFFSSRFALYSPETPRWRVSTLTAVAIVGLVGIHLMETILWTAPLIYLGILDNFRNAYFYVLESYTTLGEATYAPPDQWRLVGPIIAISGLFTFGWTGSVLVYVMGQVGRLHAERSKAAALASRGAVQLQGRLAAPASDRDRPEFRSPRLGALAEGGGAGVVRQVLRDPLEFLEADRFAAVGIPRRLQALHRMAAVVEREPDPVADGREVAGLADPGLAGGRAAEREDARCDLPLLVGGDRRLPVVPVHRRRPVAVSLCPSLAVRLRHRHPMAARKSRKCRGQGTTGQPPSRVEPFAPPRPVSHRRLTPRKSRRRSTTGGRAAWRS